MILLQVRIKNLICLVQGVRRFSSGKKDEEEVVNWFKAFKMVTSRRVFLFMKNRCDSNPKCGERLVKFMNRTEAVKHRWICYSRGELVNHSRIYASKDLACLHFAETYTPTLITILGGTAVTMAWKAYGDFQTNKKLDSLSQEVENLNQGHNSLTTSVKMQGNQLVMICEKIDLHEGRLKVGEEELEKIKKEAASSKK